MSSCIAIIRSGLHTRLARCESGVTALEFAMLAPVMFTMMLGIIEFSMVMFTMSALEGATDNGSRLGKTGYIAAGVTRQQEILNAVIARTKGLLDKNKITITSEVYSNLSQVGQPEPCIQPRTAPCGGVPGVNFQDINGNGVWDADMGAAGLGNANDIVVYTVSYPWKVYTPVLGAIIGNGGIITLHARSIVKNEPYNVN